MDSDEFYMYLSNDDSINYFPHNKAHDFRVIIPKQLNLDGEWLVALTEIITTVESTRFVNVFCDIIESQIIGDQYLKLISRVELNSLGKLIEHPHYCKLETKNFHQIHMSLANEDGSLFKAKKVYLVLHFKQKKITMNEFTIILPSDASKDIFPQNNSSNFRVQLPYELKLETNRYEVALVDISFQKMNIMGDEPVVNGNTIKSHVSLKFDKNAPGNYANQLIPFESEKSLERIVEQLNLIAVGLMNNDRGFVQAASYIVDGKDISQEKEGVYVHPHTGKFANYSFILGPEVENFLKSHKKVASTETKLGETNTEKTKSTSTDIEETKVMETNIIATNVTATNLIDTNARGTNLIATNSTEKNEEKNKDEQTTDGEIKQVESQFNSDLVQLECSIVQPSIFGGKLSPILRIFMMSQLSNYVSFDKLYYVPIDESVIRDIEVSLVTQKPIQTDKVIITLHVREKTIDDN